MINKVKCLFLKHTMLAAGACPFTGKNYNACTRCGAMIAI